MCWINMKFLKIQLCYSIIHFPANFHKKFRLEDDDDSFYYLFIKFPSQFVNSYWPQDGYFYVHIWTYWRCYKVLSTQYLTSIFSGYSCTDPYYRWHELQSDSTFPCDVLRIIVQVFNKNLSYSIIQTCQSSNACNSTYRNDTKILLQNYPSLTFLLNN